MIKSLQGKLSGFLFLFPEKPAASHTARYSNILIQRTSKEVFCVLPNILEVQNLSLSYYSPEGETKALENISFSVKKGEFLSIVGPSGSGKSTLLSILAGILTPTEGCVAVAEDAKPDICSRRTIFLSGGQ